MLRTADERPLALIFLALFFGLVIALGAAGSDVYFKTRILEVGDTAINALQIDSAKNGQELYGNYSRFEFNHPGPAFFYIYAGGEKLFCDLLHICPSPASAHLLACMALQSAFFALTLTLISQFVAWRVVLPVGLIAAALHFGRLHDPLMSIWPPHVLLMPFIAFLAACISFANQRTAHAALMVLTGGFLFHGHVAQPLFVGSLGSLALAVYLWNIRKANTTNRREWLKDNRWTCITCAALIALFLLPLAIDLIRLGFKSNVATIFGRFYANTEDHKTPLQSFLYFVSFGTYIGDQEEIFTKLGPQVWEFFSAHRWPLIAWLAIFVSPPLVAYVIRDRLTKEERNFYIIAYSFLGVTVALCVLWGMAQAGPMTNFNGYFYYGIYFFALLLALSLLLRSVDRPGWPPFAATCCAISAVGFATFFRLPAWSDVDAGAPIEQGVKLALEVDSTDKPKFLVFEHQSWPDVGGVAVYLQRHGILFYTSPWWEFMFGQRHDSTKLGALPEEKSTVWWLTKPGEGGIPITKDLSIFTFPATLRPDGDEIKFQGGKNGFRYVVTGLSVGNLEYAWTDMPRTVFLFYPERTDHDVRLIFDVESGKRTKAGLQMTSADIYVNGELVGQLEAHERAEIGITVPAAVWNAKLQGKLELRFHQLTAHHILRRPRYETWFGWALWKIRTEAVN